jgi:hypothetical protein
MSYAGYTHEQILIGSTNVLLGFIIFFEVMHAQGTDRSRQILLG